VIEFKCVHPKITSLFESRPQSSWRFAAVQGGSIARQVHDSILRSYIKTIFSTAALKSDSCQSGLTDRNCNARTGHERFIKRRTSLIFFSTHYNKTSANNAYTYERFASDRFKFQPETNVKTKLHGTRYLSLFYYFIIN